MSGLAWRVEGQAGQAGIEGDGRMDQQRRVQKLVRVDRFVPWPATSNPSSPRAGTEMARAQSSTAPVVLGCVEQIVSQQGIEPAAESFPCRGEEHAADKSEKPWLWASGIKAQRCQIRQGRYRSSSRQVPPSSLSSSPSPVSLPAPPCPLCWPVQRLHSADTRRSIYTIP